MSTRCNIVLTTPQSGDVDKLDFDQAIWLYHHSDGYPEGVGQALLSKAKQIGPYNEAYRWVNELLKDPDDRGYQYTVGLHGDIEYLYIVCPRTARVKCYLAPLGFNSVEDILKNEVKLD